VRTGFRHAQGDALWKQGAAWAFVLCVRLALDGRSVSSSCWRVSHAKLKMNEVTELFHDDIDCRHAPELIARADAV
jgi:hypothetical protein